MTTRAQNIQLPHFVVFEGVDGSGKTTLAHALARYYLSASPYGLLYANSFPGSMPGSLGEWVYRFHHGKVTDAPSPETIAPPALQLLHVAAHVDAILKHIEPTLAAGGSVILDRYWWSTYSYLRRSLPSSFVWPIVAAEHVFLAQLPTPIIVYLTRGTSLKPEELSQTAHAELHTYYQELIEHEHQKSQHIYEIDNGSSLEQAWRTLLTLLGLPYASMEL